MGLPTHAHWTSTTTAGQPWGNQSIAPASCVVRSPGVVAMVRLVAVADVREDRAMCHVAPSATGPVTAEVARTKIASLLVAWRCAQALPIARAGRSDGCAAGLAT